MSRSKDPTKYPVQYQLIVDKVMGAGLTHEIEFSESGRATIFRHGFYHWQAAMEKAGEWYAHALQQAKQVMVRKLERGGKHVLIFMRRAEDEMVKEAEASFTPEDMKAIAEVQSRPAPLLRVSLPFAPVPEDSPAPTDMPMAPRCRVKDCHGARMEGSEFCEHHAEVAARSGVGFHIVE